MVQWCVGRTWCHAYEEERQIIYMGGRECEDGDGKGEEEV